MVKAEKVIDIKVTNTKIKQPSCADFYSLIIEEINNTVYNF